MGRGKGRPKLPVAIIKANGNSNMSKQELKEREASELKVPFVDIEVPKILNTKVLKDKFLKISHMLLQLGVMTELDEDLLAQYVIAYEQYRKFTTILTKLMRNSDYEDMDRIQKMQNRAFTQCRRCASELGLSVTSRANIVVPYKEPEPTNKFVSKFGRESDRELKN